MASELLEEVFEATGFHAWVYRTVFLPLDSPYNASLLYALAYVLLMWLIAYGMYRRGWFWRV
jgi:predicted acyltransferase